MHTRVLKKGGIRARLVRPTPWNVQSIACEFVSSISSKQARLPVCKPLARLSRGICGCVCARARAHKLRKI
jgi:hypothetical protein